MIGWAIRSTSALHLDLPPLFWKKILDEEPDDLDLKFMDTYSWQVIQDLRSQTTLQDFDQRFVTLLSDGTEVELCFKGKEKLVTQENKEDYIQLLITTRLNEFDYQMKSIKEGINMIISQHVLFFMTPQEINLRATGAKTVDIEALKKITTYSVSFASQKNIFVSIELLTYNPGCGTVLESYGDT